MTHGKFVAYYRVSTDRQGRSGLGLEAQQRAVSEYLHGGPWELVGEYTEVESGKRSDRPELAAALAACKKRKATLIIAKLDRLARNVHFISGLMDSAVEFVAVDFPQATRLTIHILAAVAEHERDMISQRTKAALASKRARGFTLGSPCPAKGAAVGLTRIRAQADRFAQDMRPIIEGIRGAGVTSLRGIANALNARGIKTARGHAWEAATVRNILVRELCEREQVAFGDDVKDRARRLYRKDPVTGKRPSDREIAVALAEAGHAKSDGNRYEPENIKHMVVGN